jgi:signal transduction histidine kinase
VSWQLEEHRGAVRAASAAGLAVVDIAISVRTDPRPGLHSTALVVSVALCALIVGLLGSVLSLKAPARRLIPLVVVMAAGSLTLLWIQQRGNAGLAGAGTVLVIAAARLDQRPRVLAAIASVLFTVVALEAHRHASLAQSLVLCFPIVAVCLLMLMFQRLRDAKCKAQALLAELEQNRDAQARAAALAERQHLAREMHDVLAHSLSGLMLQLEGARMLVQAAPDDPRLPDVVNRAHELAKDGLAEARHAIGMLRGEQLPGPDGLGTLTGQFERHSGIPCTFAAAGPTRTVPPDARLAVYRVTQEALTNVVKHAHAERVEVRMTYAPDEVRLSVEDFGDGTAAAACDAPASLVSASAFASGYGLTGMRERAELLGGTLTAAATGGGFRVELRVPA